MDTERSVTLLSAEELKSWQNCLGGTSFAWVMQGSYQNMTVAIKSFKFKMATGTTLPDEEFIKEAEILSRARHPQIVPVLGICLANPSWGYALVTKYIPKGSLYNLLHSPKKIRWDRRYAIAVDIARGLEYLHSHDILHKDLKSHNVVLDDGYGAKIGDFGMSRIKQELVHQGTIRWKAPELFVRTGKKYAAPADVYSLGMILWELSSRKLPFEDALDEMTLLVWLTLGPNKEIPPEDCPQAFGNLIERCFDVPDLRPTTAFVLESLLRIQISQTPPVAVAEKDECPPPSSSSSKDEPDHQPPKDQPDDKFHMPKVEKPEKTKKSRTDKDGAKTKHRKDRRTKDKT